MGGSRVLAAAPVAASTPFVGRRDDVADVRRQLETFRVVTLSGPPGVGKTRLAARVAEDIAATFDDGAWFVDLVALSDPALLAREVAGTLELSDASRQWAAEGLADHIGERRMLLLLDNCEHLLDACAVLVDSLTRTCPNLRVLATSRQPLGIRAETVIRVAPLAVPDEGATSGDAVDLLLHRAAAVAPGFSADDDQLRAAAQLVRRLDGIPLAIELAAGRLRSLTITQVLERMDRRFEMLAGRDAAVPEHQRTLRAALDWSRDLATEHERMLWRRASVFATTFDLAAAEAVCSGDGLAAGAVLDALDGLVDKSIVATSRAGPAMRYRLLESVREYGLEELRNRGEDAAVSSRLFSYYGDLCRQAWEHWARASQPQWFDHLALDHANLRTALDWAAANDAEGAAAMAADMWLYWEARAHLTEGRRRLDGLLDVLPADSKVRPRALWMAGFLALGQSDVDAAKPLLEAAVEAAVDRSDDEVVAYATQYLGLAHLFAGDVTTARGMFEQAYEMHVWLQSDAAAFALTDVAVTAMLTGEVDRAIGLYEQVIALNADGGDPWTRSHAHWGLGVAAYLAGDGQRAEEAEKIALALSGELDERTGIALSLEALAWTAAARGTFERAAVLQGASDAVWQSIPGELPPPLQEEGRRCAVLVEQRLGSLRHAEHLRKGRQMVRADAVAFGLELPGADPAPDAGEVLSRRELEVAALVAEGITDRLIASRLVISQRTAESHVQHILAKLGFRSRTQIATWFTQRSSE